ncbi:hypothetical protein M5K25_012311 [Dendrobium thyrsiflorum]|uniref:Uncharacterized protein n=1 Tax=Dendrobium thyrsiflorum TaxID=117978 RepID=A0ABD0V3P0_DENTH
MNTLAAHASDPPLLRLLLTHGKQAVDSRKSRSPPPGSHATGRSEALPCLLCVARLQPAEALIQPTMASTCSGRPTPTASTAKEFLTGSKRREKFLQADWQVNLTSSSDSTV